MSRGACLRRLPGGSGLPGCRLRVLTCRYRLGVGSEKLPHRGLRNGGLARHQGFDDPVVMGDGRLGRPLTTCGGAPGDLKRGGNDPGEVLQHPVARSLEDQAVELGVGTEKVSPSPCARAWPMISTMSASRCWMSSRLCPAARRAASGSMVQRSSHSSRR